jgi:hypothetical protein
MIYLIYDRAIDEEVLDLLKELEIKYYTKWKDVLGVGRNDPHLGDAVWPGLNNVLMIVIDEEKKSVLLQNVRALQRMFPSVGLRAFMVPVVEMI